MLPLRCRISFYRLNYPRHKRKFCRQAEWVKTHCSTGVGWEEWDEAPGGGGCRVSLCIQNRNRNLGGSPASFIISIQQLLFRSLEGEHAAVCLLNQSFWTALSLISFFGFPAGVHFYVATWEILGTALKNLIRITRGALKLCSYPVKAVVPNLFHTLKRFNFWQYFHWPTFWFKLDFVFEPLKYDIVFTLTNKYQSGSQKTGRQLQACLNF